jgi:hypothetical protein
VKSFPFTNYDFFGYIASGFVFIFALDHVLGTGWMLRQSWTVVEGLFVTACAYAVGHIIAGFASALLERRFARRWLGPPALHLFGAGNAPAWFRRIYPVYFEPLPEETQSKVRQHAAAEGITKPGEPMFWAAFTVAKNDRAAYRRMSDFLNNYGLCRNLAFTAAVCSVMLLYSAWRWSRPEDDWWAAASLVLAAGMLLRYLKFYRHYALEVFTTYAYAKRKKDVAPKKIPTAEAAT